jgi:glycosyltransferase involved in cell wall biosynthesis
VSSVDARSLPKVSVVIPTYNRLSRLQRVLDAIRRQTYPCDRLEIVVVSDGSTDGTEDFLRSPDAGNLVIGRQDNQGPAAARNLGISLSSGSLVLFLDDDVIAAEDLVERHACLHVNGSGRRVVIGPMLTPADFAMSSWIRWEQSMLGKQYAAMQNGEYDATYRQFYTGNASLPRLSLVEAGGFNTTFRRAEDLELSYRLMESGHEFVFAPDARGYHYAERPFRSWLDNARAYGANDVRFARDHGRPEILAIACREFRHRPILMQWTARACIARPGLGQVLLPVLRRVASCAEAVRAESITQLALSGIYNVAYYHGFAEELGGAAAFREAMSSTPVMQP